MKDHLELLDAEIISCVLSMLPVIDARTEQGNVNAAVASKGVTGAPNPLHSMRHSQKHLALAVLSFCNNFRVKFLNSLSHSNYGSYAPSGRPSGYGFTTLAAVAAGADMTEGAADAAAIAASKGPGIPGIETIAHGPAANIFSRTAYFLQQPLTPRMMLQLLVRQFLTFLKYVHTCAQHVFVPLLYRAVVY